MSKVKITGNENVVIVFRAYFRQKMDRFTSNQYQKSSAVHSTQSSNTFD